MDGNARKYALLVLLLRVWNAQDLRETTGIGQAIEKGVRNCFYGMLIKDRASEIDPSEIGTQLRLARFHCFENRHPCLLACQWNIHRKPWSLTLHRLTLAQINNIPNDMLYVRVRAFNTPKLFIYITCTLFDFPLTLSIDSMAGDLIGNICKQCISYVN